MSAVLRDLTVLDLSQGIAGPMTGMLLADQGARVLKVEPPGGDPTRALSGSRVWHRGKESIVLDLRAGEGSADMERLWQLVQRADVVIESAEPGAPDHPDLTYARARRHNPRLVYCTITAYGGVPRHAGRPSQDALVAARTGLQWEKRGWPGGSIERVNSVAPFLPDFPVTPEEMEGPPRPGPLYSSVPWPSVSAFHLASMGIGAALHARERTGQGCCVTTSLLQGALVNGTFTWQRVAQPERPGYRMWVTDPRVPHGFFRTADDRWIHHWTPQPGFVLNAIHEGKLEPNVSGRTLKFDGSRVGMDPSELLVLRELAPAMEEAFGQFSSEEWAAAAAAAGVSVQPIRSTEEAFADPLFLEDGCVVEVKDPDEGLIRHVGLSIHMAATPGCVRGPAPRVGEDTDRILADLPPVAPEVDAHGDGDGGGGYTRAASGRRQGSRPRVGGGGAVRHPDAGRLRRRRDQGEPAIGSDLDEHLHGDELQPRQAQRLAQPQDRSRHGGLPRPGGRGRCRPHQHALRRRRAPRGRLRLPAPDQSAPHLLPHPRLRERSPHASAGP